MSKIGNATLVINPTFNNQLSSKINAALKGVNISSQAQSIGASMSNGIGSGLMKNAAAFGVFSQIANAAISSVTAHISDAVQRVDTMNNFPIVMQSLGYSASEANASIQTMSDRLQSLPTRLDDMTQTVSGIAAITGDLTQATNAGLALNDIFLASGSNTQLVSSAMEQFRQILAKGKPEMQDWKTLTMTAPAQMQQLAQAMLGPTANANDLYAALGGGKNEATISMDQLLDKIIELDETGGAGFESFSGQAVAATGGIGTAMANMENAITRGLVTVVDTIGRGNIAGVFNDMKDGINTAFAGVASGVEAALPYLQGFYNAAKNIFTTMASMAGSGLGAVASAFGSIAQFVGKNGASFASVAGAIATAAAAFKVLNIATSGIGGVLTGISNSLLKLSVNSVLGGEGIFNLAGSFEKFAGTMGGPVVGAITVVVAAIAGIVAMSEMQKDKVKEAGDALKETYTSTTPVIKSTTEAFKNQVAAAEKVSVNLDEVAQSQRDLATSISNTNAEAQKNIDSLSVSSDVIDRYANHTGLNAAQQKLLSDAIANVNEQTGSQYTLQDAANGVIADEVGVIQQTTNAINAKIEAKQREIQIEALSANWQSAYTQAYDDQRKYYKAVADLAEARRNGQYDVSAELAAVKQTGEAYEASTNAVNYNQDAYNSLLGIEGEQADTMRSMSNSTQLLNTAFEGNAATIQQFKNSLSDVGIGMDAFANLSQETQADLVMQFSQTGGSIRDTTVAAQEFNDMGIDYKSAKVNIEDQELKDANGDTVFWRDNKLYDKHGDIYANSTTLTFANGQTGVWNGTTLKPIYGNISVTGTNDVNFAISRLGTLFGMSGRTVVVKQQVERFFSGVSANAAGGIRPHAAGGIRYHADGAIATKAMPLDIVGEDGAEAIVPLTNRKYSQPFVDLIADGIRDKAGNNGTVNLFLDNLRVNDDAAIQAAILNLVNLLVRKGSMNLA